MDDYHSILIPKGIEYSVGVLEYFFRGKIEAYVFWDGTQYRVRITNKSGDTFKGGGFSLYRDDAAGIRTPVALTFTISYSGTLGDGGTVEATFAEPPAGSKKHTLIFKGTIGTDGVKALDPVDDDKAIAVTTFEIDPTPCGLNNDSSTIAQLRIKDYDQTKINPPCPDCFANTTLPVWQGTFIRDSSFTLTWFSEIVDPEGPPFEPSLRINSRRLNLCPVGYSTVRPSRTGCGWFLRIECLSNGSSFLWEGDKLNGNTPVGIYHRWNPGVPCNVGDLPSILVVEQSPP